MKIKSKCKWKAVPLAQTFYSQSDSSVLGGIEELTDYTLVVKGKKSGNVIKKDLSSKKETGKTQKRKVQDDESDVDNSAKKKKINLFTVTDIPQNNLENVKKKKKKKSKNKNKPAVNLEMFTVIGALEKKETECNDVQDSKQEVSALESKDVDLQDDCENVTPIKDKETECMSSKGTKKEIKVGKSEKLGKKKEKNSKSKQSKAVSLNKDNKPVELSAMNEWKELFVCEEILLGLAERGFVSPTPIQRLTLPAALKGLRDIVGAAETGSGKTLAFGIPIIQGILNQRKEEENETKDEDSPIDKQDSIIDKEDSLIDKEELEESEEVLVDPSEGIGCVNVVDDIELDFDLTDDVNITENYKKKGDKLRALILTPTRELAIQVRDHLVAAAKHTDVGVTVVVGGMAVEKQIRLLNRGPAIVVATPGRLWDIVQEGHPHLAQLNKIRYFAIDETDRMVEKGHFQELQNILEVLNSDEEAVAKRQTFVMSATLSLVHKPPSYAKGKSGKQMTGEEKLRELIKKIGVKEKPKIVDITRKVGTAETLTESVLYCDLKEKDNYLYYFLTAHPGRTIVFCNSIDCVRRLANLFSLLDLKPLPLHAQLHQKQRLKNLDRFVADEKGFLIATDVAARGLDIPQIQHVVHYQVPRTSESYVHRSGRTARASREGLSLMLIDPSEQSLVRRHCGNLARSSDLPVFPVDTGRLAAVGERMNMARQLDKLLLHTRKETAGNNWKMKAAEEADLLLSEEEDSDGEEQRQTMLRKQEVTLTKQQLKMMLSVPLTTRDFSGKYPTMTGQLRLPEEETEGAVEALKRDVIQTGVLLKGKKKKSKPADKFKGFKKKKNNAKKQSSQKSKL